MSSEDRRSARRPDPDPVLVGIADYVGPGLQAWTPIAERG
jgi:hypothetical protein